MAITVTDVNDGASIIIDENAIRAVYEMDIYRMVLMANGSIYDVTESYNTLTGELPPNGGNV
ncbi:MAG: hypothetical protein LW818_08975 [Ignavibacteriae bacterium]|jgi:hypothetical protein|nr:hypothetical protein [Ignavibacteriota bacterium]